MKISYSKSFYSQLCRRVAVLESFEFVRVGSAGTSVGGRELQYAHIGGDDCVLLLAGTHPLEYLTTFLLLGWFWQLCGAIDAGRKFCGFDAAQSFKRKGLTALFCHNPDGCEIAFGNGALGPDDRAALQNICHGDARLFNCNLNGVDLNHNFDAGWEQMRKMETAAGINGPSPRRYGGTSPNSEPETRAVISLCREFNPRHAVALHSAGEEIYYRYGDATPEGSEIMAHILAISCGYRPVKNSGLASHAGFKDWFITQYGRPAFTIEAGQGENPLPLSQLPDLLKRLTDTLMLAALM